MVGVYNQNVVTQRLHRQGMGYVTVPVSTEARFWFNEDLESVNYIVPGLIAVIMTMVGALLTALTVVREVERGSMESLMSTPLKKTELLLGKMAPYFVIGMVDMLITIAMGQFLFGVPLRGNVALLFGMAAIFLAGGLSMGMLISIVTKSQLLSSQVSMLATFLPSFLLSGFIFTIANMPQAIQIVTYIVPARYFIVILKDIYLKGVGLEIIGIQVILLIAYGVVMVSLARLKLKKKLT